MSSGESRSQRRTGDQRSSEPAFGELPEPADLPVQGVPDGAGVLAGVPAGAGYDVPLGSGPAALHESQSAPEALGMVGDGCGQLCDEQLDDAARALLEARAQAERSLVLVLADALQRGVVADSDSGGPRQWVTDRAGALEPYEVTRVVKSAEAINRAENAGLRALLVSGELTAAQLITVLREAPKALAVLPDADREEILGHYVRAAQDGCGRRELRELTRRIVDEFGGGQGADDENTAQQAETLTCHDLPGGLVELIAVLSPAHAAQIIEAITALAKPQKQCDPDTGETVRDPRTPAKRRADALLEIVGAAARAGGAGAMRSTAKVIVTMGLASLLRRLDNAGYAVTATGRTIDAGTARQWACAAELIPAVLGPDGAPMDVGREVRTFTGGLRTAIILRDRHCTFPGCDRPPGWCEGHHIVPWWAGGETSKDNGTLLCARHHHVVHSRGYLAEVTDTGVIWDLTPGRMQHLPAVADDAA